MSRPWSSKDNKTDRAPLDLGMEGCMMTVSTARTLENTMNPENIMQSKRSQTQKATQCDSLCVLCPEQLKSQRQKVDSWLSGIGDRNEGVVTADGARSPWGSENAQELDCGDGYKLCKILKTNHRIVHLKWLSL